ncbi:MAG: hypothetical protein DMF68_18845 [Acidobacteria bacterium]|nr:MAG: hypothetical protein DMF68_18845 [Acidobacteriota bacterium]
MKLCPICLRCYEDAEDSCPSDKAALVPSRHGTRMVANKYQLDRLLGRGGMGAVYIGTHLDLDRPIAIKLLLPDFTADAAAMERFRREARAAARLNHPNVADTYDYGVLADGGAYIVMEMVEGQTLREYMDAAGQLDVSEAAEIGRQVADGIEAAHRRDIVHRDLKPQNIILSRDHEGRLQAKVVDFGVAKLKEYSTTSGALTASGTLIGTPRYMSPEQCSGHRTDERSDIYSMAVILFEMLAGHPPFDAPSATAIAIKHIQEAPPQLKESRADIPMELEQLVRQSLDKDPEKRPATAAEFSERLKEFSTSSLQTEDYERHGQQTLTLNESAGGRTNVIAATSKITHRAGEPTAEHSSDERNDPSVQGYAAMQPEVLTVRASNLDEKLDEQPTVAAAESASDTDDAETHVSAVPARVDNAQESAQSRFVKRPSLIYAAAFLLLAVVAAAIWYVRTSPIAGTNNNSAAVTKESAVEATQIPGVVNNKESSDNTKPSNSNSYANSKPTLADAHEKLATALNEWVSATNARDMNKLISFYAPVLTVFYTKRDEPQQEVRTEKERLFAEINSIDVRVNSPEIRIDADGRNATMRFHKTWRFTGQRSESGEVIQELIWRNTDSGWKIVSERDAEVIWLNK